MKKLVLSFIIAMILALCSVGVNAVTVITVPSPASPNPADLSDLDHGQAYQWAFSGILPSNIISAKITFTNITNSQEPESTDMLKVWLLQDKNTNQFLSVNWYSIGSNAYSTSYRWQDDQNTSKPFNSASWTWPKNMIAYPQISGYPADGAWRDTNGATATNTVDFVFDSQDIADLIAWSADGNWAFGIDPDCHYNNCGITFTYETRQAIPEPMSMLLAVSGLGCVAALRRIRR